jgi:zinc transport system ATP-binding protein
MVKHQHVVEINHVSFSYDKKRVLEDVSLTIDEGEFLGLVGPNGSGKSTLTKLILGLLEPSEGNILIYGQSVNRFKDWGKIGYVSQKANSFNTGFPATVFEVVRSGLVSKIGMFHFFNKSHKQKALQAIEAVGMSDFIHNNIGDLSGGQQQRVFIARALVNDPRLLILDEPTVGVDAKSTNQFYELLASLNKERKISLLMITHDIGTITEHATKVACLNKSLHFHGEPHEFDNLNSADFSKFYGHHVQVLTHDHEHGGYKS